MATKLYFSSIGIPHVKKYRQLFGPGVKKVAIIANAWNVAPKKGEPLVRAVVSTLKTIRFEYAMLDLRDYKNRPDDLKKVLQTYDGVWVTGGNTFYLRQCMRDAGFDTIIGGLVAGGLVYGGESAGAVVAGTSLRGIQLLEDPKEAPPTIWQGLHLVDFGVIPHWDEEDDRKYLDAARDEMLKHTKVATINNTADLIIER